MIAYLNILGSMPLPPPRALAKANQKPTMTNQDSTDHPIKKALISDDKCFFLQPELVPTSAAVPAS
jgi:hypothetical protein